MVSNHTSSRVNPGSLAHAHEASSCAACGTDLNSLLRNDQALAQAWTALPQRQVDAGQLIAQPGDLVRSIWRVEKGLVRTYYLSREGLERNRSFHLEGQWLGLASPMSPATLSYAIEALEQTVLTELPNESIGAWLQRDDIQARLTSVLAASLARRECREESLLLKDAQQRYLDFLAQEPALAARVPLHHVASYLGITNVALSRIRRRLRNRLDQ